MEVKREAMSSSALRIALDLRVVVSRLRRRLMEVADSDDLTPSQASALRRIGGGVTVTASALAAAERVRPQSMAVTLSTLEELGLISRTPDPADGRRQLIEVTDAGQERVEGARYAGAEWLAARVQEEFSEDEQQTILQAIALLEQLLA
jgi:DNA-binding MarR family transcriptional regulator